MALNNSSIAQAMTIKLDNVLPEKAVFQEGIRRAPNRGFRLTKAQTKVALKNALRYVPAELHEVLAPEFMEELKKYDEEEIFVIGGESVYRMMLPYCSKVYVTKIDHAYQADTYFPNLDQMEDWKMTEEGEEQTCFDLEFAFRKYERC